jgi:hypothetical protein
LFHIYLIGLIILYLDSPPPSLAASGGDRQLAPKPPHRHRPPPPPLKLPLQRPRRRHAAQRSALFLFFSSSFREKRKTPPLVPSSPLTLERRFGCRAAGVLLRPGEESLLPHQGPHPWRRHSSPSSSSRSPNAAAASGGMQQEEGEAAGAAQRQGDVRRRSHLLQQGHHQVHIQAAVPLCAGVSAHGDCWRGALLRCFIPLYCNLGLNIMLFGRYGSTKARPLRLIRRWYN